VAALTLAAQNGRSTCACAVGGALAVGLVTISPALVAIVTISGYDVTMKTARVAELKARLSEYLRAVRRGESVTVLDRETPIARIVPYAGEAAALRVRPPRPGATPLAKLKFPPPLRVKVDIVALLMEERQGER
jgi:prevent-host-death family protein